MGMMDTSDEDNMERGLIKARNAIMNKILKKGKFTKFIVEKIYEKYNLGMSYRVVDMILDTLAIDNIYHPEGGRNNSEMSLYQIVVDEIIFKIKKDYGFTVSKDAIEKTVATISFYADAFYGPELNF